MSNGDDVAALTDSLLLERIQQGDTDSFETLFHRHYDRVYGLLYRLVGTRAEAEDLAQEVFVKLYRHTSRKGLFSLRKENNIGAWLYRVATNAGYDALKTRKRRWQRDTLLVPDPDGAPGAEQTAAQKEEQALVRSALGKLPQRQAQLLILRQMGLSYAECAAACDVAPGSVGTLLSRAAAAFRKEYEKLVDSP
ncbi:MAG: RNA polymerase sigma factor [Candidatus Promineifilaceae bacterium]